MVWSDVDYGGPLRTVKRHVRLAPLSAPDPPCDRRGSERRPKVMVQQRRPPVRAIPPAGIVAWLFTLPVGRRVRATSLLGEARPEKTIENVMSARYRPVLRVSSSRGRAQSRPPPTPHRNASKRRQRSNQKGHVRTARTHTRTARSRRTGTARVRRAGSETPRASG